MAQRGLLGMALRAWRLPAQLPGSQLPRPSLPAPTSITTACTSRPSTFLPGGTSSAPTALRTWLHKAGGTALPAPTPAGAPSWRHWSSSPSAGFLRPGQLPTPSAQLPSLASRAQRAQGVKGLGSPLAARYASNITSAASSTAGKLIQRVQGHLGTRTTAAVSLQLRSFWQRNVNTLYLAAAGLAVYLLWRMLFAFTSIFVSINSMFAEYGFMALAGCIVLLSFLYVRSYYAVDPAKVYRVAMRRLNMSPGVLEVLGVPVVGSELRASVLTGGGLYFGKGMRPKLRARRCQMIFPIQGSEQRGLVSLEAKKKQGKYVFKLLAVDVTLHGPGHVHGAAVPGAAHAVALEQQRIYVDGDSRLYHRGGILNELRDPFLRAQALQLDYDAEDEVDDELTFLEHEKVAAQALDKAEAEAASKKKAQDEALASAAQAQAVEPAGTSPEPEVAAVPVGTKSWWRRMLVGEGSAQASPEAGSAPPKAP